MGLKMRQKLEEAIIKLRQAGKLIAGRKSESEAIRTPGASEVTLTVCALSMASAIWVTQSG
ncbi:hypothetical protein D9599_02220 [Roseomonas sp. KE2513]|nr:hypothetical protein [Roseomonas sp. KE2513]